jgi:hypothetical protein
MERNSAERGRLAVTVAAVAMAVLGLTLWGAAHAPLAPGGSAVLSPAYIPGDTIGFNCLHSKITSGGSTICHDQIAFINEGTGSIQFSITASMDTGYRFSGWSSTGDACLGTLSPCGTSSSSNPVTVYGYCATTSKCSGDIVVDDLTATLIGGYATTSTPGNGWSENLSFTVPSGTSHVLLFWAVSDSVAANVSLPSGLNVSTSQVGGSYGVAFGALASGGYTARFSAAGGWVNAATVAVFGVTYDSGYTYSLSSVNHSTHLNLTSGATLYFGEEYTGGAYPVNTTSLTTIDEEAPAQNGGECDLIGMQGSGAYSFTTYAGGYGIVAVGIY